MRINFNFLPRDNSQSSFKAKNSVTKDADWVCRTVNTNFPAISTTWLNSNLNPSKKMHFITRIGENIQNARNKNYSELMPFNFLKNMLNRIQQNNAGNCYEKATIAELILKINGVNNCNRINLISDNGKRNLNHCVLLVNFDKQHYYPSLQKAVIIDPWSGNSGYADIIFKKYATMYNNFFKLKPNENIQFVPRNILYLGEQDINYFKENYPKLVFKSSDNHKLFKSV